MQFKKFVPETLSRLHPDRIVLECSAGRGKSRRWHFPYPHATPLFLAGDFRFQREAFESLIADLVRYYSTPGPAPKWMTEPTPPPSSLSKGTKT